MSFRMSVNFRSNLSVNSHHLNKGCQLPALNVCTALKQGLFALFQFFSVSFILLVHIFVFVYRPISRLTFGIAVEISLIAGASLQPIFAETPTMNTHMPFDPFHEFGGIHRRSHHTMQYTPVVDIYNMLFHSCRMFAY